MLVRIQLYKGESAVRLHADFRQVTDGLEEGDKVCLGAVRDKVADVDGAVVCGSLLNDGLVRERTALEVDGGRGAASTSTASSRRGRGTLGLLVRPVDTNSTRAKPLAVHRRDSLLSVCLVPECEEAIATRFTRVHVPHHPSVRKGSEGTEGLTEDLIVDFGAKVADKDVVVVARVLLILLALVCPVDANFCVEYLATVESLEGCLCGAHVHILDEAVVQAAMLVVAVWNNFDVLDRASDSEYLCKHVLGHTGT